MNSILSAVVRIFVKRPGETLPILSKLYKHLETDKYKEYTDL